MIGLGVGLGVGFNSGAGNPPSVAWWGDSLTAGSGGEVGGPPARLAATTGLTVYNGGISGENSTQIKTRMLADTAKFSRIVIIWAGRNNFSSPNTVKADIAAMVAAVTSGKYLVLSVLNADVVDERVGGTYYSTITTLNADLATLYGSRYLDVRTRLIDIANLALAQDVTDRANGVPPSSLRVDTVHLSPAGYEAIAARVLQQLTTLGDV